VRAGPPEGQRAVEVALDVDQQVEQPIGGQARNPEALPAAGIGVLIRVFRIEPGDPQRHHHRAFRDRRQRRVSGLRGLDIRTHQYFRSLGS
jgi:hypothetical protein